MQAVLSTIKWLELSAQAFDLSYTHTDLLFAGFKDAYGKHASFPKPHELRFFQIIDMLNSIAWYANANKTLQPTSQEVMCQIDQYWTRQSRQLMKNLSAN